LVMDPRTAQVMINQISISIERHPEIAGQPILLTTPTARRHIYKLTSRFIPQLIVLSHSELTVDANISSVDQVELANAS
jgi:flagellar biosynthesis protein FlhA